MIEIKWLILIFVVSLVSKTVCSYHADKLHYNYKWYKDNSFSGILSRLCDWFLIGYLSVYYIVIPFFKWFDKI